MKDAVQISMTDVINRLHHLKGEDRFHLIMEFDSGEDSNDMGGLSDNEVDIEIETANRMGNKRPAEETKGESGIRPKSQRLNNKYIA